MRMAPPSTVTVIILTTNMVFIQTELRREYNSQKMSHSDSLVYNGK